MVTFAANCVRENAVGSLQMTYVCCVSIGSDAIGHLGELYAMLDCGISCRQTANAFARLQRGRNGNTQVIPGKTTTQSRRHSKRCESRKRHSMRVLCGSWRLTAKSQQKNITGNPKTRKETKARQSLKRRKPTPDQLCPIHSSHSHPRTFHLTQLDIDYQEVEVILFS